MKKIQLLLTFFAVALMFGLIGCQKDVEASMSITETNSATSARRVSLFDSQPVIEHEDIIAKIEAFKMRLGKIETGTLSPKDVPMTVEEAVWNIEALSNSRYCQAQLPFQDLISQKATLEIPLNDKGKIDNQALLAAVQTVKEMLRAQYYAVREEQKHFIGIDIRPLVTKTVSKTHVSLEVESSIGIKINTATFRTNETTPFNADDDWGGLNASGRCDGSYTPQW